MNLFKRSIGSNQPNVSSNVSSLAELALNSIDDGVIIVDRNGITLYVNPAALTMSNFNTMMDYIGVDYRNIIRLESKEGRELSDQENPLILAMTKGEPLSSFRGRLIVGNTTKRVPVAVSVTTVSSISGNRIITFRDITKELEEEGAQAEFISTASHEMRTPVASIEGYLSLALNPQTATIDERARGYIESAHAASRHLGKLFQDLLDVTKMDDGRVTPRFYPVEMVSLVKNFSDAYVTQFNDGKIDYGFGSQGGDLAGGVKVPQVVYGYVDVDFMQEIMNNLVGNAIKYTPKGGSVWVNVRGDGDRVLINVTDTGIGISADDIQHVFQKFYRADNSDTREIGGTGLGLYLVKQRVEAMGGRIWVESGFGEGSTFFVSLPRITAEEYERRVAIVNNQQQFGGNPARPVAPAPVAPVTPASAPAPATPVAPASAAPIAPAPPQPPAQPQPQPQPIQQPINQQNNNGGQPA